MQWMMTGTVSRIAIRPDQRCTVAIQAGAPGRTIRAPVASWTIANTTAMVVSQALAYNGEEKPPTSSAYVVGWCSLAYRPSARATPQPLSRTTRSGLAYWSRAGYAATGSLVIARLLSQAGWLRHLGSHGLTTVSWPATGAAVKLEPSRVKLLWLRLSGGAAYLVVPATATPT